MGLTVEKCCCFIPLRLGTLIIALWFFVAYLLDTITGFLGINSIVVYSGQTAKAWYYINFLFTVLVLVGGLFGIFGSLFAQRRSARLFSVVVWICCGLSILKYVISLGLMAAYRHTMIQTCIRSGMVGISNAQTNLTPTTVSVGGYYSPVKYPETLNANATSEEDCEHAMQLMIISWGVVGFFVQLLQLYFATVVNAYASRLEQGTRHHRLHDDQTKDFEESRFHMSTVY
ncbi:hypothetical protein A0J61_07417 [Choanephora cucurbitarum]|uniref:Uncharacterized protein n=1 Tax=Choanephora cucurbitarum TaxID=101091 RepID=A0A1C7N667_9FUNG|nr:hypothetical protein A0J61_07417 [Choanephora cucurbitarum]